LSISRRGFLQQGGLAGAILFTGGMSSSPPDSHLPAAVRPMLDPDSLSKFVDPLSIPEIARSSGTRPSPASPKTRIPFYRLEMRQMERKVHRDLKPTKLWGFGNGSPGPTIEVRTGQEILVEWVNALPGEHFLPIDHRLHGAEDGLPETRTVIHLHGAKAPPQSDGYPEDWYAPGKSAVSHYPNQQDAAMLWYHDHSMGINRLNIYAGLLGVYIIRESVEDSLNLPRGKYEVPLVICDRFFDRDGQLFYPESGTPGAPWVPEVFGNAILVNGKLFPYLEVEPRKYRFRLLNGSNGRFYHLSLSNGQEFHQIGSDQGLLAFPVPLRKMLLGPGERADLMVDFSGHASEKVVLQSDAFEVMQFRVDTAGMPLGVKDTALPAALRPVPRALESDAGKTRPLSINEYHDLAGNTTLMLLNASYWKMPVTEKPTLDSTEIWTFINTTDDSHPIHLHLVRFQILDRRRFQVFTYQTTGQVKFTGPAIPPDSTEAGWKDTVRADPGMVTRIIIRFEGFTGRYVWHCHILEHEDNEMMRPFEVIAAK
jgi:spore coat protein A